MYNGELWRSRYGYWLKRCSYRSSVTRSKIQRKKMKQDIESPERTISCVGRASWCTFECFIILWSACKRSCGRFGRVRGVFLSLLSLWYRFLLFKLIEITLASHARGISQHITMIRDRLASWMKAKMNTSRWHAQRTRAYVKRIVMIGSSQGSEYEVVILTFVAPSRFLSLYAV